MRSRSDTFWTGFSIYGKISKISAKNSKEKNYVKDICPELLRPEVEPVQWQTAAGNKPAAQSINKPNHPNHKHGLFLC